jgi:hypothetical protein
VLTGSGHSEREGWMVASLTSQAARSGNFRPQACRGRRESDARSGSRDRASGRENVHRTGGVHGAPGGSRRRRLPCRPRT